MSMRILKPTAILLTCSLLVAALVSGCSSGTPPFGPPGVEVLLTILVQDVAGQPVQNATVVVTVAGDQYQADETAPGTYEVTVTVPRAGAVAQVQVTAPQGSGLQDQTVPVDIADPQNPPQPTVLLPPQPPPLPQI